MEYIVHHSDSYAATLVPSMIEMGIDVYQGCMETNNVKDLIAKYGDQISFMGCIENANVDKEDWTDEKCEEEARRVCETYGMKHFIPCIAQGGPGSVYPGVVCVTEHAIDQLNKENSELRILSPLVCRFRFCSDASLNFEAGYPGANRVPAVFVSWETAFPMKTKCSAGSHCGGVEYIA